jgi:hypothetical protein
MWWKVTGRWHWVQAGRWTVRLPVDEARARAHDRFSETAAHRQPSTVHLVVKILIVFAIAIVVAAAAVWMVARLAWSTSYRGPLPPLSPAQTALRDELRHDVVELAGIGPRSTVFPDHLDAGAAFVERSLEGARYRVARQTFIVEGIACANIEAELRGVTKPEEIVVIGAHYDTVDEAPGADDNASGVAAMLALARRFARAKPARTIRFVAFVNEEPPHFQTEAMGSLRYAAQCHDRGEKVVAMISLESLGYYGGAQRYPPLLAPLYPRQGDFIGFVSNLGSSALLRRSVRAFRGHARFPSEAAALPRFIPEIGWSDQWAFWEFGYPAIMVTDTAVFRNPHYHVESDTPETLDYDRFARVVDGLVAVVESAVG